ncbi:probable UDP-glucosyl transferase 73B6 [Malania oleifera]|uniref:probable UDP-glucosyl transferase 73B6 n=1 Tax=Malania oleifera TaxID=397392 RepID=UPI0025AE45B0|nr:probable UDP-glucosyl transferase 73B6 [Malania oleifera]
MSTGGFFPREYKKLPGWRAVVRAAKATPISKLRISKVAVLKRCMKFFKVSRSPCTILIKWPVVLATLRLLRKWPMNICSIPWKEPTDPGRRVRYQSLAFPPRTLSLSLSLSLSLCTIESHSRPLQIAFLPFLAPGHIIALSEMARLFSARGEHVTIITTPSNAGLLQRAVDKDAAVGHPIRLRLVHFPAKEVGLPDGLENFFSAADLDTATKLYNAMTLLRNQIENVFWELRPDCIVADMFFPWTTEAAAKLGVPRLVFHGYCVFAMCLKEAMRRPDSPHLRGGSDYEKFVIPGLPDPISMTRSQLPDYVRTPNEVTQLAEQLREAELKSYGVLANDFYELDPGYTEHYKNIMGHNIFHIGPTSLIHRSDEDKVERSHKSVVGEHECLSWLNSKPANSVVYVSFGSVCRFSDYQLLEIACGLEASGKDFIWVVLGKEDDSKEKRWLPAGFEERTRAMGMIVRGWAPQVLILDHPAIGGFVTHCGWNSAIEAISAGVPMLTWPLYAEQFYNEKLITQVLRVGMEVGAEDWNPWLEAGKKKVVGRERLEAAVRRLMDGDDPSGEEVRRRATGLGVVARRAVQEGGSSHRNLTVLIEDLKRLRDCIK